MLRIALCYCFLLMFAIPQKGKAYPDFIDIGIFWENRPSSIVLTVASGFYQVEGDGKVVENYTQGNALHVSIDEGRLLVKNGNIVLGKFQTLAINRLKWGSALNVKSIVPNLNRRIYQDNLFISVLWGKLKILNNVYLEHYIAGVVEAESGPAQGLEFYKVQAIICRTYALKYLKKFGHLGFDLCDRVNSQVYHGKATKNQDIILATQQTKGLVIVDPDINLISAVFHSNSGGMTANSEDVWTSPLPYLRSVEDTFSIPKRNAFWTFHTSSEKWLSYLNKKYNYPIHDSIYREFVLNFCPDERICEITPFNDKILTKNIRKDWNLRSAYFDIYEENGFVVFNGKGYGHGVGLSQEGAMRMAELGYSYVDILKHYYQGIHIVHLSALNFFRSD